MLLIDEEDTSLPTERVKYREPAFSDSFWRRAYAERPNDEDAFVDDVDWRTLPGQHAA